MRSALRHFVFATGCLLATGLSGAQAQDRAVPQSQAQVQLSFAPIVRSTSGAVVNVYASRSERRQNAGMEDFYRRFFGEGGPSAPPARSQSSLGSGVIVDASGLVITNNHVIENMNEVKVALVDRREFEADIVLRDPRTDLAVLRLRNATDLQVMELGDSEALQVGDLVLAVGNPFGVGQTVTQGIVSALARTQVGVSDYQFFIQTDAAINPGNSGGGLIDMSGRLIGINTAIFSSRAAMWGSASRSRPAWRGWCLNSAKAGSSKVVRPWLGARLQSVDGEIAASLGLARPSGVLITSVYDKGPATEAGLKRGDVILAVDGQAVDNPDVFGYRFTLKGTRVQCPDGSAGRQADANEGHAATTAGASGARSGPHPLPLAAYRRDAGQYVAGSRRGIANRYLGWWRCRRRS